MEFYSMLIICASMELNLDILLKYIKAYSWSRPKLLVCKQTSELNGFSNNRFWKQEQDYLFWLNAGDAAPLLVLVLKSF